MRLHKGWTMLIKKRAQGLINDVLLRFCKYKQTISFGLDKSNLTDLKGNQMTSMPNEDLVKMAFVIISNNIGILRHIHWCCLDG